MKITPEDLDALKQAVQPLDTAASRARYIANEFPRAELVKDKDKRYRWDLLWASKLKIGDGKGIKGDLDLYAYLNDDHIDTALRSIVAPLQPG